LWKNKSRPTQRALDMNTLDTVRLHIRPFTMDDLPVAHQLLDQDLQWAGPSVSLQQRQERLQRDVSLAAWADTGGIYGYRAVILQATNEIIGICGFLPILWSPRMQALFWPLLFGESGASDAYRYACVELEVGYAVASRHRRQGYATEAVSALLLYAFRELQVRRIFASTNRSNIGSIGVMRRLGMRIAINPEQPQVEWPGAPGVVGVVESRM
jgi:RimJ/RimL family protein N-acetyltransferase